MENSKCTLSPSPWPCLLPLLCFFLKIRLTPCCLSFLCSTLSCTVFSGSGFTRTLCGGQWQVLSPHSDLTYTGRLGCCSPGTFMAKPTLNPFSKATACEACPVGQHGSAVDDDITSCTACTDQANCVASTANTCSTTDGSTSDTQCT
jgi:hypothetical protein